MVAIGHLKFGLGEIQSSGDSAELYLLWPIGRTAKFGEVLNFSKLSWPLGDHEKAVAGPDRSDPFPSLEIAPWQLRCQGANDHNSRCCVAISDP